MKDLLLALPGHEPAAAELARLAGLEAASVRLEHRADGEHMVRLGVAVDGRGVAVVAPFARPDDTLLPVVFAADAARAAGARRVGLVAPYLPYLRAAHEAAPGEADTARRFARMLDGVFDWVVTVEPHVAHLRTLQDAWHLPARAVRATVPVAEWIARNVQRPFVVGPDADAWQWALEVGRVAGAPSVALGRTVRRERDVEVTLPDLTRFRGRTPVLVECAVASGTALAAAVIKLRAAGFAAPTCVAVHGIFAGLGYEELYAAGAARVVTCNTVAHRSNAVDILPALATEIGPMMIATEIAAAMPQGAAAP